ncbi:MAG: 3'(2'), 5'-bisphosphate nucleotidase [Pseudohongiellaceae bacterium]|jgi:3'(2'), 5'-bisphosphate nucleotidase
MMIKKQLLDDVISIARVAGEKILDIYDQPDKLHIVSKTDESPLTQADLAAHHSIVAALNRLTPEVPVLSEESVLPDFVTRQQWQQYWLVDPLDGTREFISRNGEFTVNIALINNGVPVLGVVYVPVHDVCYAGCHSANSRIALNDALSVKSTDIDLYTHSYACKISNSHRVDIQARCAQARIDAGLPIEVLASRHHRADAVDTLCNKIKAQWGPAQLRAMGSSLKLCLIAEGSADLYPRFGPTSEWDTAAAQAIVEAAGGQVLNASGLALRYNQKDSMLNPDFFVIGEDLRLWRQFLIDC